MLLYHVRILEDLGEFSEALNLLDVSAKSRAIVDRVSIMEFRGAAYSISNMVLLTQDCDQRGCCLSTVKPKMQNTHGRP